MMRLFYSVMVGLVLLSGCGAGIGDVCGADAGGLHGETVCSVGTCLYDDDQGVTICKEDDIAVGHICEASLQCQEFEQQTFYCQYESVDDKTGRCAKPIEEGQPCHNMVTCQKGTLCLKGRCLGRQPIGGPCWISRTFNHCQHGLVCGLPDGLTLPLDDQELERFDFTDGRCRVGGKGGEACNKTMGILCAPGFYCEEDANVCLERQKK